MTHFLLRKPDALDDSETLHCDKATIEEALLDFGRQTNAVLKLNGNVMNYVIYARPEGENNFKNADGLPVTIER